MTDQPTAPRAVPCWIGEMDPQPAYAIPGSRAEIRARVLKELRYYGFNALDDPPHEVCVDAIMLALGFAEDGT